MAILPTRTSANTNAAADINELSTEALDKGGTSQLSALTENTSPTTGDWYLLETAAGALRKVNNSNLPSKPIGITFLLRGNAYVGTKLAQVLVPKAGTISLVKAYADTAPTVTDLQIDVNKNGTTIFTTQTNRPIIAAGTNSDDSGTPDVVSVAAGDRISIDIDQIGTVAGGNDLMITVVFA